MPWLKPLLAILQKLSSLFIRFFAQTQWPRFLQKHINLTFCKWYNLNLSEAVQKDPTLYPTLDALFVRELDLDVYRPMASSEFIHPCDSTLVTFGIIEPNIFLQVKKIPYQIQDLVPLADPQEFLGGSFLVYYLCPRDYHRVHAPMEGRITKVVRAGSMLWPVNSWASQNVTHIFAENERVALEIQTRYGKYWLILVAALNVGDIEIFQDPELRGIKQSGYLERVFKDPRWVKKGEAVGAFHLGSTVIVINSRSLQEHLKLESIVFPLEVKVRSALSNEQKPEIESVRTMPKE